MAKTKIEWASDVWNPIRGCSRVSEGCRHCYAERMAARFSQPGMWGEGLAVIKNGVAHWTGKITFDKDKLLEPLHWKRPRRVFVNSISDLFHENVEDGWVDKIFSIMALSWRHQFLILTKRPERMRDYMKRMHNDPGEFIASALLDMHIDDDYSCHVANYINGWSRWREMPEDGNPLNGAVRRWPLPNVWLGTSVEDQKTADLRIPFLLQTPAAIRFISAEPLLGSVDLTTIPNAPGLAEGQHYLNALKGYAWETHGADYYDVCNIDGRLHWVIVGGESGPGARPMNPDWARLLRNQCLAANVPYFFKQWGEYGPCENGEVTPNPEDWDNQPHAHTFPDETRPRSGWETVYRVGKKSTGHILDSKVWQQYPEVVHESHL
jgi:protein gp37